ncbi:MAG: ribonuclease III, partial [Pseudomonadota bacterium]
MSELKEIDLTQLEKQIGHHFKNKSLLEEALTHPSMDAHCHQSHKNYQRLEFLGDRVLGLVIADMLLRCFKT